MGEQEFQGVLYDIVEEVIIERSAVLRATYAEAMTDAEKLVTVMNARAEAWDDESGSNTTVGRVDESYCFVLVNGVIAYSEAETA